jgi:hypothetical protein
MTTTLDREPTPFHTTEKIGPKRARTPEGFLICYDVPLARTGFQEYAAHEIEDPAASPPPQGFFRVERTEGEVFSPVSIASWQGKPITNDHPPDLLTPNTCQGHSVGTMINPRRGEGEFANALLVDWIITDAAAIADLEAGKDQVSGGYNCDYFEVAPGHLQQRNIVGNHGAMVNEGRCGDLCTIRDHAAPTREPRRRTMVTTTSKSLIGQLLGSLVTAYKNKDDKAFEAALGSVAKAGVMDDAEGETAGHVHHSEGSEVHIHLPGSKSEEEPPPRKEDPMDEAPPWFKKHTDSFDSWRKGMDAWKDSVDAFMKGGAKDEENKEVEGELEEEAPPGTALNDAKTAKDSAFLADSFQGTVAGAEVLAPGIRLPTLDRSAKPGVTFKVICGLRRAALDHAMASAETLAMVREVTGGRMIDTKKASCRDVRNAFHGVVALKKASNRGVGDTTLFTKTAANAPGPIRSIADLNKTNTEYYEKKKASSR